MPTPKHGETEDRFMTRCIRQVRKEGKTKDTAIAECLILWNSSHNTIRKPFKVKKLRVRKR